MVSQRRFDGDAGIVLVILALSVSLSKSRGAGLKVDFDFFDCTPEIYSLVSSCGSGEVTSGSSVQGLSSIIWDSASSGIGFSERGVCEVKVLTSLARSSPSRFDFSLRNESIENKRRGNGRAIPGLFDVSRCDAMSEQCTWGLQNSDGSIREVPCMAHIVAQTHLVSFRPYILTRSPATHMQHRSSSDRRSLFVLTREWASQRV